jgi:alpha-L-fucosidase
MDKSEATRIIKNHQLPAWFDGAKLGIFIHWGLFSVPAYAYVEGEGKDINQMTKMGLEYYFAHNPYAEWYLNTLRIDGSPTQAYHQENYGTKSYEDFANDFNDALAGWDPAGWADLFQAAGARYAVLVTKHHDGFTLWPSDFPNPNPGKENYHATRDVPGELAEAVRARGLRFGTYYSGKLDWSFTPGPIHDAATMLANGSIGREYIDYANNHWHELINKYEPDILWNDIGYPVGVDLTTEIFAPYYQKHPDGVINDRFIQIPRAASSLERHKFISKIVNGIANRVVASGGDPHPKVHHDFTTPEYKVYPDIRPQKWESNRGVGFSFGYNKMEDEKQYLSLEALIHLFVDIVSKNGNLLLNVGPMVGGTILDIQRDRLLGLGKWLSVNGEAIYNTKPWDRPATVTADGLQVRFTTTESCLYAILLGTPAGDKVTIKNFPVPDASSIEMLGADTPLDRYFDGRATTISLPGSIEPSPAITFKIDPSPSY